MEQLPQKLTDLLSYYDDFAGPISEAEISGAIRRIRDGKDNSESPMDWLAEAMAFDFCENYQHEETGWGTYFGPMMVWKNGDGTISESPSIKKITPEIFEYWTGRATQAKNPVMRARYADLVWDFSKVVTGKSAHFNVAHNAIDSIIEIAQRNLHKYTNDVLTKLQRALSLSLMLNKHTRVEKVRDAIIDYEDYIAEDDKPGTWGFAYDILWDNKKVVLTGDQKHKIITDLETRLERISNPSDNSNPNPWAVEAAALRLANYYRKQNLHEKKQYVLLKLGEGFERISKDAAPLQASMWIQHVYTVFLEYGFKDEANRIAVKLREIGPKVAGEMKEISHEVKISSDKIDKYISSLTEGNLEDVLDRIGVHYVPKKKEIEDQLKDLSKRAPISFLFSRQIQDHQGRPIATIGPLENDQMGHVVHQMSQNMSISSVFLRMVMESTITKFALSAAQLVSYIFQAPVFAPSKQKIIESGIQSYLEGNYLVAIHLLIPQIEDAIRNIVELTGGSVLKPSRGGGLQLKTLDELLRDDRISGIFGEDAALYFRVLLTDERGWNLRNGVCHGIVPFDIFGPSAADRVIHELLCLAQVREQKASS